MEQKNKEIKEYPVGSILGEEEIEAIRRVIESGDFLSRGQDVELFEKELADYCGAKYAIATSSCSGALHLTSKILKLTPKDEVIVQANSFWATFVRLLDKGVNIKVADIDKDSLNIDPESVRKLVTNKTKAIYLVHHGGNPADLDSIKEITDEKNIKVVEDAAHAMGSEYKHKKIGSNSELACFSFSSLKNMSTLGEGGAIVTNNKEYFEMANGLRMNFPFGEKIKRETQNLGEIPKPKSVAFLNPGDAWDYDWLRVDEFGMTYRISTPQAAVGRVQLKKIDRFNKMRENIAKRYNEAIENINELRKVKILPNCKHAWHIYSFFLNKQSKIERNELAKILKERYNVHCVIRFWPIHLGGIMRMRGHKQGECPVCEDVWFNQQLSLPISPQMKEWEINGAIEGLKRTIKFMKNG